MTSIPSLRRMARMAMAAVTASMLLATMAATASAEQTTPALGDTITLTAEGSNSLNGPDFRVARLAGFTIDGTAVTVAVEPAAKDAVIASLPAKDDGAGVADDYQETTDGDPITWLARQGDAKDSPAWRIFAERMAATDLIAGTAPTTGTPITGDNGTISKVVFDGLTPGLYMLIDANTAAEGTTKSSPILVGTAITGATPPIGNADGTVEVKNQRLAIDKSIIEDGGQTQTADRSVGDTVDYRIATQIPDTSKYANEADSPYMFRVEDTLSKGQRFNDDLTVESSPDGATWTPVPQDAWTVEASSPADGTTATVITIDLSSWTYTQGRNGMVGGAVRISYSATLTDDAVIDGAGNTNGVTLTYSNDPATNQTGRITPPDTRVYTHGFRFTKTGSDGTTPLKGATFTLYAGEGFTDADKYRRADKPDMDVTATSGDDGVVAFTGLAAGTYWVKETGIPDGYRDLDVRFKVTITADHGSAARIRFDRIASLGDSLVKPSGDGSTLVVSNVEHLTQLPLTGSVGTTMFVVVALLLAAGGIILALVSKRQQSNLVD
ncbi:hypothetical protein BW14_08395 [Bifidobacterium sp. UTBIF-68]|uniref:SpaH/EbpB family LPXTG-anchored major pilin n=1 Tax=Bifidobacterium sp. UTBIF-68 TaxID=1465262 RepID=UPI001129B857|nr:SpaH/EbpB family LPXTG-anchored major pilin [Bifidobacterium sp. UTBIF-68]TPF92550.1 hypothetical protein BW14_08395 [Bifidobacterium sp. UTBIF-68]